MPNVDTAFMKIHRYSLRFIKDPKFFVVAIVVAAAGLFTGCFVTLFSVYGILAHLCGMFSPTTEPAYMETVYPVFRYLFPSFHAYFPSFRMLFV